MSEEKKDLKTSSSSMDKKESDSSQPEGKSSVSENSSQKSAKAEDKAIEDKAVETKKEKVSVQKKETQALKENSETQAKTPETSPSKEKANSKIEAVSKTDSVSETESSDVSISKKEDSLENTAENKKTSKEPIKLNGLFAFKMSMTRFYNEKGESLPVTALKYEPSYVSQVKTEEKDSYSAVQVAFKAQKNKRCSKPVIQHLKPAGFKEGARFIKEIKQTISENIQVGDELSIRSIEKGDLVRISALSKGKGFTGVMKRWNFGGGRASHGSKAHRRTGSIGQHTKPGRVFPGRKMPGHHGFQKVSRLNTPVVEVLPEEGIIFVKGPVPGARNTLVSLQKMSESKR